MAGIYRLSKYTYFYIFYQKTMSNQKLTQADIDKAQDLVDSRRDEAMQEVTLWDLKSVINFDILEKDHVIEYLKSWESKYLDSIITANITLPKLIKTNQDTLLEIEAIMEKLEDKDSEEYIAMKASRMETINQIKSTKGDIENRKKLFADYDLIITNIKTSLL